MKSKKKNRSGSVDAAKQGRPSASSLPPWNSTPRTSIVASMSVNRARSGNGTKKRNHFHPVKQKPSTISTNV